MMKLDQMLQKLIEIMKEEEINNFKPKI